MNINAPCKTLGFQLTGLELEFECDINLKSSLQELQPKVGMRIEINVVIRTTARTIKMFQI